MCASQSAGERRRVGVLWLVALLPLAGREPPQGVFVTTVVLAPPRPIPSELFLTIPNRSLLSLCRLTVPETPEKLPKQDRFAPQLLLAHHSLLFVMAVSVQKFSPGEGRTTSFFLHSHLSICSERGTLLEARNTGRLGGSIG